MSQAISAMQITIFTWPLAALGAAHVVLASLLLSPRVLSTPISRMISKIRKNTVVQSVYWTICMLVASLLVSSVIELYRRVDKVKEGTSQVDLLAAIEFYRSQGAALLCLLNLLLAFLCPILADEREQLNYHITNFQALQRQALGQQVEYERVAAKAAMEPEESAGAPQGAESDEWKLQTGRLVHEKNKVQETAEATAEGKAAADTKVEELLTHIKRLDKEFELVTEENKLLKRRLAQLDPAAQYEGSKKDD